MKYLFVIVILLGFKINIYSQGENNIWMFGRNYSLDFNHTPPLLRDDEYLNGTLMANTSNTLMPNIEHFYDYAQAVCDANGNLLFMVKKHVVRNTGLGYGVPAPNIFDRDEVPIEGTEFLAPSDMYEDRPLVIPHPGNSQQYYVFYVRNGGLLYSLFDLSLNNGKGDIVPGFKNVLHYPYNSIIGSRIVSIQGCDGVWMVARHRLNNQFLSFKFDISGLAPSPVISQVGLMATGEYGSTQSELAVSPNGKLVGVSAMKIEHLNYEGGIELFDFEKCSGKLKNPRLFETGNIIYGLAFSPDNSKLYASYSEYNPMLTPQASWWRDQNIYQFDLELSNLSDIVNSKTLIIANPTVQEDLPFCPLSMPHFGSMRIGKDQKLYIINSAPRVCDGTSGVGMAIHVINNPNLTGLLCNPNINAIYNTQNGMVNGNRSSKKTDFPYEIVFAPSLNPDTISHELLSIHVCYRSDTILKAPNDIGCLQWSTGSTDRMITVSEPAKYWLRYTKDCTVYIDTFDVTFSTLPEVASVQYGCPGYIILTAGKTGGTGFEMDLYNENGGKIYGGLNQSIHQVHNLDAGVYRLNINSGTSCDTTLQVALKAYPAGEITIDPPFASINYGEEIQLTAHGGNNYTWSPASSLNLRTSPQVTAKPEEDTRYEVIGINEYGCRDTAYTTVEVGNPKNIRMPNAFTPNGDGLNDIFSIPVGKWNILKFEVYNRYGQLVYRNNLDNNGWDGTHNGISCDVGVYYYVISIALPDGTNTLLKGVINLIR